MKNPAKAVPQLGRACITLFGGLALTLLVFVALDPASISDAQSVTVIYVDSDANGAAIGLSWTDAYTSLQDALAAATDGDEIWVAGGIYYPDQGVGQTDDDRSSTFTLTAGVALYGGFAGDETTREQRDWNTHVTVLSGDIDQNDTVDSDGVVTTTAAISGSNAYHVVSSSGVTETTCLDGFVVTAGQENRYYPDGWGGGMYNTSGGSPSLINLTFSGNWAVYGGGMYNHTSSPTLVNVTFYGNRVDDAENGMGGGMYNIGSSPTLSDVTFYDNVAYDGGGMVNVSGSKPILTNVTFSNNQVGACGGGMHNGEGSPTLHNVTFDGNRAGDGGGMYNGWGSSPVLDNVTFSGNLAWFGGAIHNSASDPTLRNVIIRENRAYRDGGGIFNHDSSPALHNVVTYGNRADDAGGGIYNEWDSSPMLVNVTLVGNQADIEGGGMYNRDSSPTLVNCILWANAAPTGSQIHDYLASTPDVTYSDVQGGYAGTGNIDADPLFVDVVHGDLRLGYGSPVVDAGSNYSVTTATDLDGNPRRIDIPLTPDTGNGTAPLVDMGAYEAHWTDVALSKTVYPTVAVPGETITFTLTFVNGGSVTATDVTIADPIPAFLSVTSVFSHGVSITDTGHEQPFVWAVQDLAPGAGGAITLTGQLSTPPVDGIYTNTATIATNDDIRIANNTGHAGFLVNAYDVPVFTDTPVTTATEDVLYLDAIVADDPDLQWGDALTVTAPVLPDWLTFIDIGDGIGVLAGVPAAVDVGDHPVVLRATDSTGLTATHAFTLTVIRALKYKAYFPLTIRNGP